jgi:energy-coupling factor transporter ATP-binding protein EcfA2
LIHAPRTRLDFAITITELADMSQPAVSTPIAETPAAPHLVNEGRGVAEELISTVRTVQSTLRGLLAHEALFGKGALAGVEKTLEEVESRLARQELLVVVVGERRSGKSTLLDAIVGDRLLGGARGKSSVVTLLRRRALPSYRARLASGAIEDFSRRVPDKTSKLVLATEKLEQAVSANEALCRAKRSELRRAIESRERADLDAEQARSGVAGAREREGAVSSELSGLEDEATELERAVGELSLQIPAQVRVVPPSWALWLWLLHSLYVLFRRGVWQRYQTLLRERDEQRQRLLTRRNAAREAAQARQLAEAGQEPLGSGADQARVHSSEVEQALRRAEAERERVRGELEALRSEREHHESERWRQFFAELGALSQRSDVVELSIDYPAKLLPDDVTIVDIPGLVSAADPEWSLLSEQADGCILVSELDRAVSEQAKQFLRELREVVPHVLLVLTKMDQAFQNAARRGEAKPWDQVELARRIGTRRFARELGRDPSSVLSISVAAEAVLSERGSELALRFDGEIEKLFVLLRRERALILGARAADALRRCIASFSAAEARAERAYRERIATLEQQRTPEPDVFKQELLADVEPAVVAAASETIGPASTALQESFLLLQRWCEQSVDACATSSALLELAEQLSLDLPQRAANARRDAYLELESSIDRGVAKLERGLLQAVRTRYQLLHELRRSSTSSPRLGAAAEEDQPNFDALAPQMRRVIADFRKSRFALGASGSLAGLAGGALVNPWVAAGAGAIGGLLALARRESTLRSQALNVLTATLAQQEMAYLARLREEEPMVIAAIRSALERSLERAIIHFGRWITEPLEAERRAIEAERQNLLQLEQLREQVCARDRDLERSLRDAVSASAGLSQLPPASLRDRG